MPLTHPKKQVMPPPFREEEIEASVCSVTFPSSHHLVRRSLTLSAALAFPLLRIALPFQPNSLTGTSCVYSFISHLRSEALSSPRVISDLTVHPTAFPQRSLSDPSVAQSLLATVPIPHPPQPQYMAELTHSHYSTSHLFIPIQVPPSMCHQSS